MSSCLIRRLLDNCTAYVTGVCSTWPDDARSAAVGQALAEADSAIVAMLDTLEDRADLVDSKELRRYLSEMVRGIACWNLCVDGVPDSVRKPARLTLIALLKQWTDRATISPVV